MKIILASQSPRRKDLLTQMGLEFEVLPSDFDEQLDDSRSPEEVASELALGKALAVAEMYPDAIVIGADTIVTIDGQQLGKPIDQADNIARLKQLSGRTHSITTGLAVVRQADGMQLVAAETCQSVFKPYDARAVAEYVATGDGLDKAGGYGLQSGGAVLVDHFEGRLDTIIGLPTQLLSDYLAVLGVESKAVDAEELYSFYSQD